MDRKQKKVYALKLVDESPSIYDSEKLYWKETYDIMTPEQVDRLISIIENEKLEITRMDKKYGDILAGMEKLK